MNVTTSEDIDVSLSIMVFKALNKGRATCSKENWNMVLRTKDHLIFIYVRDVISQMTYYARIVLMFS